MTNSNAEAWATVRAAHRNSVVSLSRYPGALHESGGAGLSAWWARQALIGVRRGHRDRHPDRRSWPRHSTPTPVSRRAGADSVAV